MAACHIPSHPIPTKNSIPLEIHKGSLVVVRIKDRNKVDSNDRIYSVPIRAAINIPSEIPEL